jgi:hypothetical protein
MRATAMSRRIRPQTPVQAIKQAVRAAEKRDLDKGPKATGASGFTLLRLHQKPIALLIETKKIGPEELQAAQTIEKAFFALSGALMFRPLSMEKLDRGRPRDWDAQTAKAVELYRGWADYWSIRAKQHSDRTLKVVIGAVIDERSFRSLDDEIGYRRGTAKKAVARGLRDFAAHAGWVRGAQAAKWRGEALATFPNARFGVTPRK